MANGKKRSQKAKKTAGRRRIGKSVVKRGASKPMLTAGSLLVTGIRVILSCIPGANAIAELADFAFKSIGVIKNTDLKPDVYGSTLIDVIGLGGCVYPRMVNIIGGSPLVDRNPRTDGHGIQWINTDMEDGQLISVTFTISPTGKLENRSGSWCVAFTPWRVDTDEALYTSKMSTPEYITLSHMLGSVSGPANKPLTLTYRPGSNDGYASMYKSIDTSFGMLCIAYESLGRVSTQEFSPDEFSCDVRMKGTVRMRTSYIIATSVGHADQMTDPCKPIGMGVRAMGTYQSITAKGMKCVPDTSSGRCKFSGTVYRTYSHSRRRLVIDDGPNINDMVLC